MLLQLVVAYAATCGTVTSAGRYTAPTSGFACSVIATSGGKADTASVILTASVVQRGIPFGPTQLWSGATVQIGPAPFTGSKNGVTPGGIVSQINAARTLGQRLQIQMTSGSVTNYLTNGSFDFGKWKAVLNGFNTSTIKQAVAQAVADGTVYGYGMIDEPETQKWGGTITKATIDSMARYSKTLFPTLPTGINVGPPGYQWRATERFTALDFVEYHYRTQNPAGTVDQWRAAVLAQAAKDGVTPALALNVLDGGTQDKDGTWDCGGTGGLGTYSPNCRMLASQIKASGLALVAWTGCELVMWWFQPTYATWFQQADNQASFKAIADSAARVPRKACSRP